MTTTQTARLAAEVAQSDRYTVKFNRTTRFWVITDTTTGLQAGKANSKQGAIREAARLLALR